jgi:hypothetical protein
VPHLYTGLGFGGLDNTIGQRVPADTQVAVGPTAVVEMVNTQVSIWTRAGIQRKTFALSQIVGERDENLSDPQVLYDALSGRWFAAAMNVRHNGTEIAVSDTSDPTQGWTSYERHYISPYCPDQPRLGVSDTVVAVTAALFAGDCGEVSSAEGGVITVYNKQDLLRGADHPALADYGPSTDYSNYTPVQSLSPTPIEYFVAAHTPSSNVLHIVQYLGAPPRATFGATDALLVTPLNTPPGAVQPGTRRRLDTGDNRLSDASYLNGVIYLAANDACNDGTSIVKSCARLMEVSTTDHRLLGEADIGFADGYAFYTALRPDAAGNVIAEFGYSSRHLNPSIGALGVRGPLVGENGGLFSEVVSLASGSSPNYAANGRWGDYMGAALDPVHPTVIWVGAQVGDTAGGVDWGTHIDTVSLDDGIPAHTRHQVVPGIYSGRTNQDQPVRIWTSGDGRRLVRFTGRVIARCRRRYMDSFRFSLLSNDAPLLIHGNGRFNTIVKYAADRFATSSRVRLSGTVFADRMAGTLIAAERSRQYGGCYGRARWSAR